jgi:hypothetical protein
VPGAYDPRHRLNWVKIRDGHQKLTVQKSQKNRLESLITALNGCRVHLRYDLRFGACVMHNNAFPCADMMTRGTESQVKSQIESQVMTQVDKAPEQVLGVFELL